MPLLFLAQSRSIPAWAGEPLTHHSGGTNYKVYPRVGGGTLCHSYRARTLRGLSPRGRGNPSAASDRWASVRSIPAWAGEPQTTRRWLEVMKVYPRVGGGTDICAQRLSPSHGLSPRGRGNHLGFDGSVRVGLSPRGRGNLA